MTSSALCENTAPVQCFRMLSRQFELFQPRAEWRTYYMIICCFWSLAGIMFEHQFSSKGTVDNTFPELRVETCRSLHKGSPQEFNLPETAREKIGDAGREYGRMKDMGGGDRGIGACNRMPHFHFCGCNKSQTEADTETETAKR